MINTNYFTRLKTEEVFQWLSYPSWVGGAIFFGALATTNNCHRSEHIASTWGGLVVLAMIFTYGVRVRFAQQIPMRSALLPKGDGTRWMGSLGRRHRRQAAVVSMGAAASRAGIPSWVDGEAW